VQAISSFAMYGFPESHAASFALIAYASAYLKVHYLAAFTCGLLNNQPMGFYSPAVLVKDAQRHGLRVRPIDVQRSEWLCTLERATDGSISLRLGMNYAKGVRKSSAEALMAARAEGEFASVDDLARRAPVLNRKELVALAQIGALNSLGEVEHRRDALWQVEWTGRPAGPLLREAGVARRAVSGGAAVPILRCAKDGAPAEQRSGDATRPLRMMTAEERLAADFAGTGLTTGPHPMAYVRAELRAAGIRTAKELETCRSGGWVTIAGCVIARQRPLPCPAIALPNESPYNIDWEELQERSMSSTMPKEKIHPNYAAVRVLCAPAETILRRRSTHKGDIHVEICSVCHPFFTGKQTTGRYGGTRGAVPAEVRQERRGEGDARPSKPGASWTSGPPLRRRLTFVWRRSLQLLSEADKLQVLRLRPRQRTTLRMTDILRCKLQSRKVASSDPRRRFMAVPRRGFTVKKNWDNPVEHAMPAEARVPAEVRWGGGGAAGDGAGADGRSDGHGVSEVYSACELVRRARTPTDGWQNREQVIRSPDARELGHPVPTAERVMRRSRTRSRGAGC
jgi:ribosomal protein L31